MLKRSFTVLLIAVFAFAGMFAMTSSNAAQAQDKEVVSFVTSFEGDELADFRRVVENFNSESDTTEVRVEAVGRNLNQILNSRVVAGNPPDMANFPQPGVVVEFAQTGDLVPIDGMLSDEILAQQPQGFLDFGTVDGQLVGVTPIASLKSLVWYNKPAFEAGGYEIPGSLQELKTLTEQIAADGTAPWCIGVESGAASGWPGTDWMEDLALRMFGAEFYDAWVAHDIPWTDERVKELFEEFLFFTSDEHVFGGSTNVLATNFGDAVAGLVNDPPDCLMHRQATFIREFIANANPDVVFGEDIDVFIFPPGPAQNLDGGPAPILGGGDVFAAFSDSDGVAEFLNYVASVEAQRLWALLNPGRIGTNKELPLSVYVDADGNPDQITRNAAEALTSAELFRFDGSDLMPGAVGAGSFWTGVLDAISGESLDTVLQNIEASADDAYSTGEATD